MQIKKLAMRAAVLFSGGKDSTLAAWTVLSQGWKIECLLTIIPESRESFLFHYPNAEWCALQAKAMGLEWVKACARGGKNEEVEDLKKALQKTREKCGVEAIVSGALESEYQKEKIDSACEELGLKSFAPLWRKDGAAILRELVSAGWKIFVSAVSAEGLEKEWLGRLLDAGAVEELCALAEKHGFHAGLEGGEGETFTSFAPGFFEKEVRVEEAAKEWSGVSGRWVIKKARLA